MLLDLSSTANEQLELALDADSQADTRVGSVIDKINDRFGRGTVLLAGAGTKHQAQKPDWEMKQERRTQAYTTSWADLPIARA